MAFFKRETGTTKPNFLASEIGLIQKTYQGDGAGIVADPKGRKIIIGGSIYPKNDATAVGIVFEDVDVTDNLMPISVIVAGRIIKGRLETEPSAAALTPLVSSGIVFADNEPQTTRP